MNLEDQKIYPSREKLWPERDAVEKLEALHSAVLGLIHRMNDIEQLFEGLERHMHMPDGRVVREVTARHEPRRVNVCIPMGLRTRE